MAWDKWKKNYIPKYDGNLGLKTIHLFAKALVAKSGWRQIT
jgi:hypothetical protein